MDNKLDLNAIAILAKVAEAKSFRGAAKALGLPRSTVSLKVAQLENQVGVQLLERTTRVVKPTEAGSVYLRYVFPALEALSDASRVAADLSTEPSGLLRITAPPELGQWMFRAVLATYLSRHPSVRVQIELTARRVHLLEEGFDLAIRAGELPDSSFISRAIGPPQQFVICASPDYLRGRETLRHPRDLKKHECLVMSDHQEPTRWRFRDRQRRITVDVEPRASVNSFVILRDLASAGCGIARLPYFVVRNHLQDGSLCEFLSEFALPSVAFHALYPIAGKYSSKVQTFIAALAEEIERDESGDDRSQAQSLRTDVTPPTASGKRQ